MAKTLMKQEESTKDFDFVGSKIFNFHSVRSVITAKHKQKIRK